MRLLVPLIVWSMAAAPAQARDSAADALAGHRAEQRQWQGETDPLRRPLFYDAVDVESPVVGLPCDHRPRDGLGTGYVVLLRSAQMPPRHLRYFMAPGGAASLDKARTLARDFAKSHLGAVEMHEIAARAFLWCR